jgi:hypothetical protein
MEQSSERWRVERLHQGLEIELYVPLKLRRVYSWLATIGNRVMTSNLCVVVIFFLFFSFLLLFFLEFGS